MFPGKLHPRCSGCLPKYIMQYNLDFYVFGLLYVEKDDNVVKTKLQFFLATNCTSNVTNSLNYLNLFRMGLFGVAYGLGGGSLKSVTYILH